MLHETLRRARAKLSREAAREAHALALDVAPGRPEALKRRRVVAKLDADFL